ncbi:TIGR02678 family protein [Tumebacillus avium]|uniref:TIGR02678 family protein n=1 Tax=Tumebacillus avium TaxID=1903704 RepID=A0A1Y0IPX5_9BACL|nr:TIGR02678 family protein [Tumebacillus avium]ARU61515.1 TIGR02678 family protein [Tumebacillus avium]
MDEQNFEFDEETKECVHALFENFWISRTMSLEMYVKIRERETILRKYFEDTFRWRLQINKELVKLEKVPVVAETWMGISAFRERLDYVLFCCLMSFLESKLPGERFLLSTLCDELLLLLNEIQPDTLKWTEQAHRRSFIRVLKYAETLKILTVEEGNVFDFGADEEQEVLFVITALYPYFLRRTAKEIKAYTHFEEFLQEESLNDYHRLYRHIFTSPLVHRSELTLGEKFWLDNVQRRIGETIVDTTNFELEVYREAALLTSSSPISHETFPDAKGISMAVLHLAQVVHGKVSETHEWATDVQGRLLLANAQFREGVHETKLRFGYGWSKEIQTYDLDTLVREVLNLLKTWKLAEESEDSVCLFAPLVRMVGQYPIDYQNKIQAEEVS